MPKPTGHKVVIYFYEDHGHVVDTIATDKGYKEVNYNKAHFSRPEEIVEAIRKVYDPIGLAARQGLQE